MAFPEGRDPVSQATGPAMPRRPEKGFDLLASLPWPLGILLGIAGFLAIRYGIPWHMGQASGPVGEAFAGGHVSKSLNLLGLAILGICWLAAGASFFRRRESRRLYAAQAATPRLEALGWLQFEQLVGEWFRRQGYSVIENVGAGSDGGIDLLLHKQGRKELVQCKHWRRRRVDVATVREMWGLLQHHRASAVWIVCSGDFTRDARAFAEGKPIHLVTGSQLAALLPAKAPPPAGIQCGTPELTADHPALCRRCGSPVAMRRNRRTGDAFLGCTAFPKCRETMPLEG